VSSGCRAEPALLNRVIHSSKDVGDDETYNQHLVSLIDLRIN
jgi:hypothetical protein